MVKSRNVSPSHLSHHLFEFWPKYHDFYAIYWKIRRFYSIFTPGFVPFGPFLALLLPEMVSIMSQHNLVTVSHWYSFVIWIRQQNWPQKQRKIAFIHCFMAETGLNSLFLPPQSIIDVYNLVKGQCHGLVYHFISIPISFIFIQVWETQFFMPMPILKITT